MINGNEVKPKFIQVDDLNRDRLIELLAFAFNDPEEARLNYIKPNFDKVGSCFRGIIAIFFVKLHCCDNDVYAIEINSQHTSTRDNPNDFAVFRANVERVVSNTLNKAMLPETTSNQ